MGYWKREYTERKTTRPLFRPEPKDAEEGVAPVDTPEDEQAPSEDPDGAPTRPLPTPSAPVGK